MKIAIRLAQRQFNFVVAKRERKRNKKEIAISTGSATIEEKKWKKKTTQNLLLLTTTHTLPEQTTINGWKGKLYDDCRGTDIESVKIVFFFSFFLSLMFPFRLICNIHIHTYEPKVCSYISCAWEKKIHIHEITLFGLYKDININSLNLQKWTNKGK